MARMTTLYVARMTTFHNSLKVKGYTKPKSRSVLEATGTKQITPLFAEAKRNSCDYFSISPDNHICRYGYSKARGSNWWRGRGKKTNTANLSQSSQPRQPEFLWCMRIASKRKLLHRLTSSVIKKQLPKV